MTSSEFGELWNSRRRTIVILAVVLTSGVAFGAFRLTHLAPDLPSLVVKRGEFVDYAQFRGEAKALKSVTITAPFRAGDLQIIRLAHNGAAVKKSDVVVQFDATKVEQDLAQNRSALKAAEAEIEQSRAQARLKEEQDVTDVTKARYDVEAAKLDASKEEILSKIDGEEAKLKLADTEQKLEEVEEKLKSDRAGNAADIESKQQKRDKALYDVRQAEQSLSALTLKAPIDGIVTVLVNWRAGGFFGGNADFKEGDRAWPGAAIAELPDLSSIRITGRIDETERGRLKSGQTVTVRLDSVPDRQFTGSVAQIGTIASTDFSAGWPFPRDFYLEISLDQTDQRLRPGMSASVRVAVDRVPDAIVLPADASFQKSGRTVAYVLRGSRFEERVIEVGRRSGDQLLVTSGLKTGERVALKDPTTKE